VSILETVLIFAGIPAAVIVAIYGIVYAGSARHGRRYRPGRPFEFRPVWFLSAPEQLVDPAPDRVAVAAVSTPAALPASARAIAGQHGATGGASDNW